MTNAFWQAVAETSWWVYLFFLYFFYIAFCATKARIVQVKTFYILPVLFMFLTIIALITIIKMTLLTISIWIGTLFIGIVAGWLHFYLLKIKAVKNENKLYIPGTWSVFFFIILVPVLRYHFYDSFNLQSLMEGGYSVYLVCLYGIGAGLTIGRLIYSLRCIKAGPYLA